MNKDFFQRQKFLPERQFGFLSIEVIVVIVIVLGLISLGASKLDILGSNSKATEEVSNIQALYASTTGLKSSQGGYGASGTNLVPTLIADKSVPKNITEVTGVLYNLHGGTITIVSNGNTFTLTENDMPADACIKLAKEGSSSGLFGTTRVNSSAAITGAVSATVASTQCSGAGSTNDVAFTTAS